MKLHTITTVTDPLAQLIKDDPVRPEIAIEQRVNERSRIYVLLDDHDVPQAVTCVRFLNIIPATVQDMFNEIESVSVAVFYTIWSYSAGAGRQLIQQAQGSIKQTNPEVTTWVTLSPKTEMARKFHHRNGAQTLRENQDTVNYIYS